MKILWLGGVVVAVTVLAACTSVDTPSQHSTCRADNAAALVGTRGLNDAQIKEVTGANMVRRLLPNQAMTKDHRVDRVNIIIDVPTKQIISASCG